MKFNNFFINNQLFLPPLSPNTVKLADLLDENRSSGTGQFSFGNQGHPTVTAFHRRAANYLASIEQV